MPSIPNERGLTGVPSRRDQVALHVEAFAKSFRLATAVRLCVHALADRKAFTPQDVPALCIALDLMRDSTRRRGFSGGSELPAVTQRLDIAGGVGDGGRTGVTAIDRFNAPSRVERDR